MGVFDELKEAFRQAVENFKTELNRETATDAVDSLLGEMRKEAIDAEAYLHRLGEDLSRTRRQAEAEEKESRTCRRREEMALEIGDEETARVAGEFAAKHENRKEILVRKAEALHAELTLRKGEVAEIKIRLKKAISERDALAAEAGRVGARRVLREDSLFEEMARMEELIDDDDRFGAAAEEIGRELDGDGDAFTKGGSPGFSSPEDGHHDLDERLDERLAELKRRMQEREGDAHN